MTSSDFENAGYDIFLRIDNDAKTLETFELNHKEAKSICGDITQITCKENRKYIICDVEIDVI